MYYNFFSCQCGVQNYITLSLFKVNKVKYCINSLFYSLLYICNILVLLSIVLLFCVLNYVTGKKLSKERFLIFELSQNGKSVKQIEDKLERELNTVTKALNVSL